MISCNLKHEPEAVNERGWPRNTCQRCDKVRYAPDHFSKWRGDPQWCGAWPFWWELGCWLTLILEAVLLRREAYLWLKRKLGFGPQCGCAGREALLNRLGAWIYSVTKSVATVTCRAWRVLSSYTRMRT